MVSINAVLEKRPPAPQETTTGHQAYQLLRLFLQQKVKHVAPLGWKVVSLWTVMDLDQQDQVRIFSGIPAPPTYSRRRLMMIVSAHKIISSLKVIPSPLII
ncbi:unnamed protein product [Absidia cylindrospora]